jgi:hypothetical protein
MHAIKRYFRRAELKDAHVFFGRIVALVRRGCPGRPGKGRFVAKFSGKPPQNPQTAPWRKMCLPMTWGLVPALRGRSRSPPL